MFSLTKNYDDIQKAQEVFNEIKKNLDDLNPSMQFEISNLASIENWNSLSAIDRRNLGMKFSEMVNSNLISNVEYVNTKSNHHNIYKKKIGD